MMKTKTFLISGIVGGVANWLLGWLFYGILFASFFPQPEESSNTLILILLGCVTYGLFISFIYNKWAKNLQLQPVFGNTFTAKVLPTIWLFLSRWRTL